MFINYLYLLNKYVQKYGVCKVLKSLFNKAKYRKKYIKNSNIVKYSILF